MNYDQFKDLTYKDFKRLAAQERLSKYERIGFPTSYRSGKEGAIFKDLTAKLSNMGKTGQTVVDIGPGCSDLPLMIIEWCREHDNALVLIDSEEMLAHLPNECFITKVPAYYPDECTDFLHTHAGSVDIIVCYSVFHYVFAEGNVFSFLDQSLALLADGGEMLIGDIPNISKRKRFFSSKGGILFHQEFTDSSEGPVVEFNVLDKGAIDDSVILSVLLHCRLAGFDAYWVPQPSHLPMANRREDLLIKKP